VAQDRADRVRDVAGREAGRRDLVEQRLEEVVVAAVDHGQPDGGAGKLARRRQAPESGPDHDDFRKV